MNNSMQSGIRTDSAQSPRQGMALLFVISLILFITLLGASFVVVSTQFSKSAKDRARIDARGDSSRSYVYRAFYDLVRGPENPATSNSPLNTHDILADMYGYGVKSDGVATVNPNGVTAGAFDVSFAAVSVIDGSAVALSAVDDIYNGQVLTFTNGAGRGISCRVIDYNGTTNVFTILPETSNGSPLTAANLNNSSVLLNGRPFSGWGAGGVAVGGNLGIASLMPRRMNDPSVYSTAPNGSAAVPPTFGAVTGYAGTGVNESYDSYNFQNMFLAMYDGAGVPIRASFNQPNLFAYNVAQTPGLLDDEKYANFRPPTGFYADQVIAAGDPNAVAVNSANGWANPTEVLDVDNDGDGLLDSVWIDPGYPVQTDIDGRRYKPLVAYLVLDMDSRLNVNANGSLFDIDRFLDFSTAPALLGNVNPDNPNLPNGQHLGPPEVSLEFLFNNATVYANVMQSRYGPDVLPGIGLRSDIAGDHLRDPWLVYENFGHPDMFHPFLSESYPNAYVGGLFGTTLDIHGRYSTAVPQTGLITDPPVVRPLPVLGNSSFANPTQEIASSAYEFSLLPQSRYPFTTPPTPQISDDQPFTSKDVERFLRQYDRDIKMQPSRLWDLTSSVATPVLHNYITANSWEVPTLPSLENAAGLPISPVEAIFNLLTDPLGPNLSAAQANIEIEKLLAPEIRMGLPMDLNRPFGNGQDDNGNGVYDEHWQTTNDAGAAIPSSAVFDESAPGEIIRNVQNTSNISLDTDADGTPLNNHLARQNFARHLYVLALLATDDTAIIAPDFINHPLAGDTARRVTLAQWAINVVDFRDSDSIFTPFEMDVNPFNGWDVDGWLGVDPSTGNDDSDPLSPTYTTERYVVWGAERPELLISETLVTHDRRSENLDADPDFENRLTPRAAAFIELYHPWNQNDNNQLLPAELQNGLNGIDLNDSVAATDDPVWRLLVVRGTALAADLNPDREPILEDDIARKIYFIRPDTSIDPDDRPGLGTGKAFSGQKVYYASVATNGLIARGGYAVIGSSGVGTDPVASDGVTFFGRRTGPGWVAELDQTRRIDLDPATPGVDIEMYHPVDDTNPLETTVTRTGVARVIIDQPRSLGLSDPDGGYGPGQIEIEDGFQLATPTTSPVDLSDPHYSAYTMIDGVSETFSQMYLQRLANPLAPFNRITNPYVTIDSKPLDLIAFNGVEDDSADPSVTTGDMVFAAAERGRLGDSLYGFTQPAQNRRWLWSSAEGGVNLTLAAGLAHFQPELADNHVHNFNLYETFGEINGCYTDIDPLLPTTTRFDRIPPSDLNSGANPPVAFTGLTWNNRPFAGHMDLLDVPYTDGFELLQKYTPYDIGAAGSLYDQNSDVREFGHLFNFYVEPDAAYPNVPRRLSALLDYVRVPSRFAGTRTHLNSTLPPYNVLSRYREPGKINLNLVANVDSGDPAIPSPSPVWRGLLGPFAGTGAVSRTEAAGSLMDGAGVNYGFNAVATGAAGFEGSRRGLEQPSFPAPPLPGIGPAVFDNPFRTASEFGKVPTGVGPAIDPVQVTLLRNEAPTVTPLFDYPSSIALNREMPFANPLRDAASRHELFRKIANTTTTRSSVFSIWITVGRFEVDENGNLLSYADGPGSRKLQELGSDNGKAQRSRGFFMIDRSIPVAYEPGKNHNIENMILVETIIE